ncbi:hypothetical protein D8L93_04305 [Sodalis-like symbiont of Bactericera trigonica]|nr:hypothetical protein D8L93_04305 [Sodalis-like symbiont of Bactericera trigonica]
MKFICLLNHIRTEVGRISANPLFTREVKHSSLVSTLIRHARHYCIFIHNKCMSIDTIQGKGCQPR